MENVLEYLKKGEKVLKKAININALADGFYNEKDIEIMYDYILTTGDIRCLNEKNAILLIKNHFNVKNGYIDFNIITMLRDYINLDIESFSKIYFEKRTFSLNKERVIKNVILNEDDLSFLDCASYVGLRRKNNEDFALAISKENRKLLLVCDGVGSSLEGDKVSRLVALEFKNWFEILENENNIQNELKELLFKIKERIKREYFMSATTLTFALVLENKTIIGNIGDSRCYVMEDSKLKQVTEDDNEAYIKLFKPGYVEKDDLRFLQNNVITNAVDRFLDVDNLELIELNNDDYDVLLLLTDGVFDILSDKKIEEIIEKCSNEKMLTYLLKEACFSQVEYPKSLDEVTYPTLPGKDNVTASVYVKSNKIAR